jgi:serine/threonine protein kinase
MNVHTQCPEPASLKLLLEGMLPPADESSLCAHLDDCTGCQHVLQGLVARGESWANLPARLRHEPVPTTAFVLQALARAAQPTHVGETDVDLRAAGDLLTGDFLEPPATPGGPYRIGPYEVRKVLGRGGMGVVFLAHDPVLHRDVAIKVMAPQLACLPTARQRFLREAQAAAAITHDNIVTIHHIAEFKSIPYLVLHYIAGPSLQECIASGPLPLSEVVRIGLEAARGLEAAHARGLVHRDVKPANILVEADSGRVRLTDFGLARATDDVRLTQSGAVAGTPQYMAPEQARGETVDQRADLFSLGSVLYALCTGKPPYEAGNTFALLRRITDDPAPSARAANPEVPSWLDAIIARLHAKDPSKRFQTAAEVAVVLEQHLGQLLLSVPVNRHLNEPAATSPGHPKGRRRIAAAVAIALLLAGLGVAAFQVGTSWRGKTKSADVAPTLLSEGPSQQDSAPSTDPPKPAGPPVVVEPKEQLAKRAQEMLATYCYRCHGENGNIEGGLNYLMDSQKLIDRRKVVPGQPGKSRLLKRILDGEMPPDGEPRPIREDEELLTRWVVAGAPAFAPQQAPRSFIAPTVVAANIQTDLEKRKERDRLFTRYFTLTHLYNAGLSEDELQTYRNGLSKLLNSLSWEKDITLPVPIDAAKTVLRIDLREYGWTDKEWEALLALNPYGSDDHLAARKYAASVTGTEQVHVRGDWFVAAASRPPLYHQLLQLPKTERELERLVHIDVEADIRTEKKVARAGFNESGVSRNNRLIERHRTADGAYWKSYDFSENRGPQNLFERPLGPGTDERSFRHVGGEIIFSLPNGLQGYLLVNGKGERIDKGPTDIVSDPKRPDRAVENGLSCMSCHAKGINPKTDQIRAHVLANVAAFPDREERDKILALYAPADEFNKLLKEDAQRFEAAVAKTGAKASTTEPIMALATQFEMALDLQRAAAEVGLPPQEFLERLEATPEIGRAIGNLKLAGGTVQRQTFVEVFPDIVREWKLGELDPRDAGKARRAAGQYAEPAADGVSPPPARTNTQVESQSPLVFRPHLPQGDKEQVPLSGPVADAALGGSGRYIIFRLAGKKRLAVFDVQSGRVARELPLLEEEVLLGAGAERVAVVYPGAKLLQFWNLATFERERTVTLPGRLAEDSIGEVSMGSASAGPLFANLRTQKRTLAVDLKSLEVTEVGWKHWAPNNAWGPVHLRSSPDGKLLSGWGGGWAGLEVAYFDKGRQVGSDDRFAFSGGAFGLPSADGRLIFAPELVANRAGNAAKFRSDAYVVPAVEPGYFLALIGGPLPLYDVKGRLPGVSEVVLHTDERQRLFSLKALDELQAGTDIPWEKQVHYYPTAGLLVTLGSQKDKIVLRRVDLAEQLEKSGADFLVVVSRPPPAHPGSLFTYRIAVRSKKGGVKVKLEAGPPGLTVASDGRVSWPVPIQVEGEVNVLLTLKDASGQELSHSFKIDVSETAIH